jgi:hypothetical protein
MQFFEIKKERPLMGLADQARQIIDNPLPIKCLEAVVLSIFLINEMPNCTLEKFTIGFKTKSKGNVHRHVVLGVYSHSNGLFGALGTSRRDDLAYKSLTFKTLTDLLLDYIEAYTNYLHRIKRIKISLPIPKSNRSFECIAWSGVNIALNKHNIATSDWLREVEKHSRLIKHNNLNSVQAFNFGLRQATSLRNLTNLGSASSSSASNNNNNNGGSYLSKHLAKLAKLNKQKSVDDFKKSSNNDVDDEENDDREYSFNNQTINSSENDERKSLGFLPRTAPANFNTADFSQKLPRKLSSQQQQQQQLSASSKSFLTNMKGKESLNYKLSKDLDVKRKLSSSLRV